MAQEFGVSAKAPWLSVWGAGFRVYMLGRLGAQGHGVGYPKRTLETWP